LRELDPPGPAVLVGDHRQVVTHDRTEYLLSQPVASQCLRKSDVLLQPQDRRPYATPAPGPSETGRGLRR
jgi:hypothetical protein